MELGWIDFTKSDRDRAIEALKLIRGQNGVDELGVASFRDGFADFLFPGTSTLHTRAKYFLIVPYAIQTVIECASTSKEALELLYEIERQSCYCMNSARDGENGIIGSDLLNSGKWVKSAPSSIYWSALRRYNIIKTNFSVSGFLAKAIKSSKKEKVQGSTKDKREQKIYGTPNVDVLTSSDLLPMEIRALMKEHWHFAGKKSCEIKELKIKLTSLEAGFLKKKIIESCKGSLFAVLLENNVDLSNVDSVQALSSKIEAIELSEEIKRALELSEKFSRLVGSLRCCFDEIIKANKEDRKPDFEWDKIKNHGLSANDVDEIRCLLSLEHSLRAEKLAEFSKKAIECIESKNGEELTDLIKEREYSLKGSRAKTSHKELCVDDRQYGGSQEGLTYRFGYLKQIIMDILEGEKNV